ncbi:MAG: hypothetical protein KF681_16690 [Bdellovibrionaceae bacterium]|nr:hypothetical protein [Pseudobdellovibrionaceae bacterium]
MCQGRDFLLFLMALAVLVGCDSSDPSSKSNGPSNVTAASCSSPKTRVIDTGFKGTVTGVGRGLWSDTKVMPGTQIPATAYYDGSATGGNASLKASYWDGAKFNVETVAADTFVAAGSATWVKLAFLTVGANKGRPLVVWTTGALTVKAALRSAAFGSTGTWSTAVIDTLGAGATRAASVSVSPVDHVGITYLTNSTTAGRARFIYCDSPCASLAGFTTMTANTDVIENTTQAANIMGVDTGWCKFDATTYYPVAVYHGNGSANTRYAVCSSANLSTCQTSAGWTASNISTVAAPVLMSLHTDPSVTQDGVRILVKPAAATALTTYTSASGCQAPGAFTVGTSVASGTTAGTAWAKLLRDSGGRFHIVTNTATTSVSYINSATSNFQSTAWYAAATLDTVTLPAAGAGAGGADLANSYGMVYASYGQAAAPFNLSMAIVNDINVPSNNAAAIYYAVIPDYTGGINMPLAAGNKTRNVSVAASRTGEPAAVYIDHSAGALAGGRLKYALRSGSTADSSWSVATLPNTINPLFPALAFDHEGLPWVSYYDSGTFKYFLATNTAVDGLGTWTVYQAPINAKTASATAPATDDTAIAMAYVNGKAQPVLILMNSTAAGGQGLRALRLDPETGVFGAMVTVDALGAQFATRLSADFDLNGNIVIAYYDLTTASVRFNFTMNGGDTWKPASVAVTGGGVGREGLSIRLNPKTSKPALSYYQASTNSVFLSECTSALASCNSPANWTSTTVQNSSDVGVSAVPATTHEQMLNTSLTFDDGGVPFVSYMGGLGSSNQASALVVSDRTSGFTPTAPVTLARLGPALAGASPVSQAQYGASLGSVRNALGQLITVHVGPNNWLYATSCGD